MAFFVLLYLMMYIYFIFCCSHLSGHRSYRSTYTGVIEFPARKFSAEPRRGADPPIAGTASAAFEATAAEPAAAAATAAAATGWSTETKSS